jgi:uncharacterized protein YsxB (DUF464 family)
VIRAEFDVIGEDGIRLHISGHSETGRGDGRLVCAAVSGIAYALAGYLCKFKEGESKIVSFKSGELAVECERSCEEALKMTYVGLTKLAISYPEHLKLTNRVWYREQKIIKEG